MRVLVFPSPLQHFLITSSKECETVSHCSFKLHFLMLKRTDVTLASRITQGFDYSLNPCNTNSMSLWEYIVLNINVMYQSNHLYLIVEIVH